MDTRLLIISPLALMQLFIPFAKRNHTNQTKNKTVVLVPVQDISPQLNF